MDYDNPEFDTKTSLEMYDFQFRRKTLAVINNCNALDRYKQWSRLVGSEHVGCGINSIVFLNEMTKSKGEVEVSKLKHPPGCNIGTPMEVIVEYLNKKSQQEREPEKRVMFELYREVLSDPEKDTTDESRIRIFNFYIKLYNSMPKNSCIIVKLERDINELIKHNINLTPGHTIVITKDDKGDLYSIDPQSLGDPKKIKIEDWKKAGGKASIGTFNALIVDQYYRKAALIFAHHIDCSELMKIIILLTHKLITEDTTNYIISLAQQYIKWIKHHRKDILISCKNIVEKLSYAITEPKTLDKYNMLLELRDEVEDIIQNKKDIFNMHGGKEENNYYSINTLLNDYIKDNKLDGKLSHNKIKKGGLRKLKNNRSKKQKRTNHKSKKNRIRKNIVRTKKHKQNN